MAIIRARHIKSCTYLHKTQRDIVYMPTIAAMQGTEVIVKQVKCTEYSVKLQVIHTKK